MEQLDPYLEDLEERIDEQVETELFRQWVDFVEGRWMEGLFAPRRPAGRPPGREWPVIPVNAALADPALMLLHQLGQCSRILAGGKGELLGIRANYGTAIIPTLYGAELFVMPQAADTLPTCRPLAGGLDEALRQAGTGGPDLAAGLGGQVLGTGRFFREVLEHYPRLARHVRVYHPDLQGPMDACELLLGSSLFTELVDRPPEVHLLLGSLTRTIGSFMERWQQVVPPMERWSVHWGMLIRGQVMLRDDSATNLSPGMFREFVRPYDGELLKDLGGGAMHFCGKGDRFIQAAASIPQLHAVHMSQPELNDLETICAWTIDRGITITGLKHEAGARLMELGRPLRGRVHCWDGIPK